MSKSREGRRAIIVDPRDNVATLTDARLDRTTLAIGGRVAEGVPYGHKVSTRAIAPGGAVVKYGVVIGHASAPIEAGDHVHVHNVVEPSC